MDFTALKAELAERGFDYLTTTRQGQFINDARAELDDMFTWPYLLTTLADISSPTAISDFRSLRAVYQADGGAEIPVVTRDWLRNQYGDLSTVGTAAYAYMDGASTPGLRTYPHQSSGLNADYYRYGPDLSAGTDEPLAPERFHGLIVDLAVERAYRDSDNHTAAEQLRVSIERRLAAMVKALLMDGSTEHVRTGRGFW